MLSRTVAFSALGAMTKASWLAAALVLLPGCNTTNAETAKAAPAKAEPAPAPEPAAAPRVEAGGKIEILVDAGGYTPAEIIAPPRAKITLAFKRTTEQGCGETLVIESMKIQKDLPVGTTVEIPIETPASGEVKFACGMDMYRGKVVVKG